MCQRKSQSPRERERSPSLSREMIESTTFFWDSLALTLLARRASRVHVYNHVHVCAHEFRERANVNSYPHPRSAQTPERSPTSTAVRRLAFSLPRATYKIVSHFRQFSLLSLSPLFSPFSLLIFGKLVPDLFSVGLVCVVVGVVERCR